MHKIIINGKEFPARMTMGALLRFKRETGKDVSEVKSSDVAAQIILLWCCVVSACKADGVPFTLSLEEFADTCDTDVLRILDEEMVAETQTQKKTEM